MTSTGSSDFEHKYWRGVLGLGSVVTPGGWWAASIHSEGDGTEVQSHPGNQSGRRPPV